MIKIKFYASAGCSEVWVSENKNFMFFISSSDFESRIEN